MYQQKDLQRLESPGTQIELLGSQLGLRVRGLPPKWTLRTRISCLKKMFSEPICEPVIPPGYPVLTDPGQRLQVDETLKKKKNEGKLVEIGAWFIYLSLLLSLLW